LAWHIQNQVAPEFKGFYIYSALPNCTKSISDRMAAQVWYPIWIKNAKWAHTAKSDEKMLWLQFTF